MYICIHGIHGWKLVKYIPFLLPVAHSECTDACFHICLSGIGGAWTYVRVLYASVVYTYIYAHV